MSGWACTRVKSWSGRGTDFGPAVNRTARLAGIANGGQVLCSDTTAGLVGGEFTLVDLGEHRLRDLSVPQRVFQLVEAGLPDHFPALMSVGNYPGNLPLAASRFVGRTTAVHEVACWKRSATTGGNVSAGQLLIGAAARTITAAFVDGDHGAPSRIAVEFAGSHVVGQPLTMHVQQSGAGAFDFVVLSDGQPILASGRAELG